ncbi:hypothetical protein L209DRAFT_72213 [Thermothelomyces heterothallicus CBS 203.75]
MAFSQARVSSAVGIQPAHPGIVYACIRYGVSMYIASLCLPTGNLCVREHTAGKPASYLTVYGREKKDYVHVHEMVLYSTSASSEAKQSGQPIFLALLLLFRTQPVPCSHPITSLCDPMPTSSCTTWSGHARLSHVHSPAGLSGSRQSDMSSGLMPIFLSSPWNEGPTREW